MPPHEIKAEDYYITLQDATELSKLTELTVRRHIWNGKLVASRPGNTGPYRINIIDFHVWMKGAGEEALAHPRHK